VFNNLQASNSKKYTMLTIKCAKCNRKLLKYEKIGKGRVLRCWHDRIIEDFCIRNGSEVRCACGNVIGAEDGVKIRMKQRAFTYSGTKINK